MNLHSWATINTVPDGFWCVAALSLSWLSARHLRRTGKADAHFTPKRLGAAAGLLLIVAYLFKIGPVPSAEERKIWKIFESKNEFFLTRSMEEREKTQAAEQQSKKSQAEAEKSKRQIQEREKRHAAEIKNQKQKHDSEENDLSRQLAEAKRNSGNLKLVITNLSKEFQDVLRDIAGTRQQLGRLGGELQGKQDEVQRLQDRIEDMKSQRSHKETNSRRLEEKIQQQADDLGNLRQQLGERTAERDALGRLRNDTQQRVDKMQKRVEALQERMGAKELERLRLLDGVLQKQKRVDEMQNRIEELKHGKNDLGQHSQRPGGTTIRYGYKEPSGRIVEDLNRTLTPLIDKIPWQKFHLSLFSKAKRLNKPILVLVSDFNNSTNKATLRHICWHEEARKHLITEYLPVLINTDSFSFGRNEKDWLDNFGILQYGDHVRAFFVNSKGQVILKQFHATPSDLAIRLKELKNQH